MTVHCFPINQRQLPSAALSGAEVADRIGTLLYPHWLLEVGMRLKPPLIRELRRRHHVVVDGITGTIQILSEPIDTFVDVPTGNVAWVPFGIPLKSIDRARIRQNSLAHVSRRMRNWAHIRLNDESVSVLVKAIDVYEVSFAGTTCSIALDTFSGSYGLLPEVGKGASVRDLLQGLAPAEDPIATGVLTR